MPLISKFKMKILLGWCIFSVLKSCLFICFSSTVPISNFNDNVLVLLQASHFVARWKSWRGKVLATKTSGKTFLGGRSICPMVGHKKANGERVIIRKFEILIYIQWKKNNFRFLLKAGIIGFLILSDPGPIISRLVKNSLTLVRLEWFDSGFWIYLLMRSLMLLLLLMLLNWCYSWCFVYKSCRSSKSTQCGSNVFFGTFGIYSFHTF